MDWINNYKIVMEEDNYNLIIYLNENDTEFAKFGNMNNDKKNELYDSIKDYVKTNFPKIKITACKVMLGSLLLATIPITNVPEVKAADVSANYINYTVKAGDSLWRIANNFNTTIANIQNTNNISGSTIYVDQVLKVPSATNLTSYEVKSGDTLYKISRSYGTTVDRIKQLNNLTGDVIYVGQKLSIENSVNNTVASVPSTYKVQAGDTLWKIANRYDLSVNHIKNLNNLTSDTIYVGQVLTLKGQVSTEPTITYTTYKVQSGDNIWTIALDHGIPQTELMKVNNFNENTSLSIGQTITIPVHHIPVQQTQGEKYGEYLDWWTEAQYVFATNKVAKVTDFETGRSFMVKRTIGANHADSEPLTASDAAIAKEIWGGYSWKTRAITVEVDGRKIAASMSYMPHSIQYIENNNFDGHFDIHFKNSTRHKDGEIDPYHQDKIKVSAGITQA